MPQCKILCLADGRGRNSVYLASLGYQVTAVDSSKAGLKKAQQLAKAKGVEITTVQADLTNYELGTEQWQGIVSIFFHLAPALRKQLHSKIYSALKLGGVFLLEAYTPKQLQFKTGGPANAGLTMQSEALVNELKPMRLKLNKELIRDVHEGSGHTPQGAVVQVIGKRQLAHFSR